MNIYIDESGSFVNASSVGAWNAVAALAVPEAAEEKIDQLLTQLRKRGTGSKEGRGQVLQYNNFVLMQDLTPCFPHAFPK